MKRVIVWLLICVLLVGAFAGCGSSRTVSGTEGAKLLLANERLNAKVLKGRGNLFDNGAQVLRNLATVATENLVARTGDTEAPRVVSLSAPSRTAAVQPIRFKEVSNSYEYFKHLTNAIVDMAEQGAQLIDDVKKNVRVVDKWVDYHNTEYYLHVEENSETLIQRCDGQVDICRRYKNEQGKDVYELYTENDICRQRMLYIPGERYERSEVFKTSDGGQQFFVADNSKGYWQTYEVGVMPEHYNVTCIIMRDDICSQCFYDPRLQEIAEILVISEDRATDIMRVTNPKYGVSFSLVLNGFDGVKDIVADTSLTLTNGKTLTLQDYMDGKVSVRGIHCGDTALGEMGEMILHMNVETFEEGEALLVRFLKEYGLTCRRDLQTVLGGIDRSFAELEAFVDYYRWNGCSVNSEADMAEALEVEMLRLDELQDLYEAVKDEEVIAFSRGDRFELNVHFAPVTVADGAVATYEDGQIVVENIALFVEDMTLFVKDEAYVVGFAMAPIEGTGNLIHLEVENQTAVPYPGEGAFEVSAARATMALPLLDPGRYTLVSYISTADGIRTTAYIPVAFGTVAEEDTVIENVRRTAVMEQGRLCVTYALGLDFYVDVTAADAADAKALYRHLAEMAYVYGLPVEGSLESYRPDTHSYGAFSTEEALAEGQYRIS